MTVPSVLVSILQSRIEPAAHLWLCDALAETVAPFDARAFRLAWSRVGRKLGSQPVTLTPSEAPDLQRIGVWPFVGWGADECGRAALLVQAMTVSDPEAQGPLLDSLYLRGTIRERQALLRALALLPEPERFTDVAIQASRSHVVAVFEAIAVANPYPVRHLPRAHFDQLVNRAMALRVGPERIVGLSERLSSLSARPSGQRRGVGAAQSDLVMP